MNSKRFLTLFLLLLCLFTFVRAVDEDIDDDDIPEAEEEVEDEEPVKDVPKETEKVEAPKETPSVAPKEPTVEPKPTTTVPQAVKPTTVPQAAKPTTTVPQAVKPNPTPAPAPVQKTTQPATSQPASSKPASSQPATNHSSSSSSSQGSSSSSQGSSSSSSPSSSSSSSSSGKSSSAPAPTKESSSNNNVAASASANNAAAAASANNNAASPANNNVTTAAPANEQAAAAAPGGTVNPIIPANNNQQNTKSVSGSNNTSSANNENKEEGGNGGAVKTTVISLVAVGAVVGVATVGVRVYNKKNNNDRGLDLADIEAQPINNDFGKSNDDLSGMPPEEYNPYNIMNDAPNEPYITNNPYEYKPNYDNIETTPFNKANNVEAAQDNFMSRESIFSNPANNIPQIGNDVFNFSDNTQLPYVQEHPIENSYIEEPVANQISVENNDMSNSQMPTLVPVQPEIVITQPDDEPAQEGYKQIVPNVAQMEIIETPDFNNMTVSMIEDHINNMDLENLANTDEQQDEADTGYKQIVPDIQEAVIENFDIDDDEEEDPDMSVVDNITDTYRAALRATYCSTATDENRFSYRTVDSDHSLLHTMREDGQWWIK